MSRDAFGATSVNVEGTKQTYSAAVVGFTPVAVATDFLTISNPVGSGKVIRVTHTQISGIATAGAAVNVLLIKRSTLNTGGTPTTLTAVSHDSQDIAAVGLATTYAANPTLGTTVGTVRNSYYGLGTAASVNIQEHGYDFGSRPSKAIKLYPGECLSWNNNGQAVGAGTLLDLDIEWTEEPQAVTM